MMATPALVPTLTAPALTMRSSVGRRADAARRLDADVRVEAVAEQFDVLGRSPRAARAPVDVFTKSTPACSQMLAGEPLELVVQVAGLDDRLDDHLPAARCSRRARAPAWTMPAELVAHQPELPGEEGGHVDDDVDLVRAALHGLVGRQRLDPRRVGAERERDDRARLDVGARAAGPRPAARSAGTGRRRRSGTSPPRRRASRRRRSSRRRAAACDRWSWRVLRPATPRPPDGVNGQAEPGEYSKPAGLGR